MILCFWFVPVSKLKSFIKLSKYVDFPTKKKNYLGVLNVHKQPDPMLPAIAILNGYFNSISSLSIFTSIPFDMKKKILFKVRSCYMSVAVNFNC